MTNQIYKVKGDNILDPITTFLRDYDKSAYESAYPGGFLRFTEDSGWFSKSYTMVCIRVDTTRATEGMITIEAISGGSSSGIFGTEDKRLKDFGKELQLFCKMQNMELEFNN